MQITAITSVAFMVGSNRIIRGQAIIYPVGNADLEPKAERALRRDLVEKALNALETDIQEQRLFEGRREMS